MRGIAIALAITGALAVSGIAAPTPVRAGQLASTPYGCDPSDGSYPGYAPPYAYAAYYYGYPRGCGGTSIYFYFAPAYYGYRYGGSRYFHHWHHGWHRHWQGRAVPADAGGGDFVMTIWSGKPSGSLPPHGG